MAVDYLKEMVDLVAERIQKREKLKKPPSYYELADRIRGLGVKITQNGMLSYKKPETESMRWQVMAALAQLGPLSDKEVMDFVRRSLPQAD